MLTPSFRAYLACRCIMRGSGKEGGGMGRKGEGYSVQSDCIYVAGAVDKEQLVAICP